MTELNWTRFKAPSKAGQARRASLDEWYVIQRGRAGFEAKRREGARLARVRAKRLAEHGRRIARLKRLWLKALRARLARLD